MSTLRESDKTHGHLGQVSSEDARDVMRGILLLLPVEILSILWWRMSRTVRYLTGPVTHSWWTLKLCLKIPHALIRAVHSECALHLGSYSDIVSSTPARCAAEGAPFSLRYRPL